MHNVCSEGLNDKLLVALSVLAGDIATCSASGVTLFSDKIENVMNNLEL